MSDRGFSVVETICALAIVGIAVLGVLPAFQAMMDSNSLTEERWNAVAAAQQVMERLRQAPPVSLPTTGSSPVEVVRVGDQEFEVVASYCTNPALCTSNMRHILLEVGFAGSTVYRLETVYAKLR